MENINRGQLRYVFSDDKRVGKMVDAIPAVIISNDINNEIDNYYEVVYLSKDVNKHMLPTDVSVVCKECNAVAVCGRITTVKSIQMGDYIGEVTEYEMEQISKALAISCGINYDELNACCETNNVDITQNAEYIKLQAERDLLYNLLYNLLQNMLPMK